MARRRSKFGWVVGRGPKKFSHCERAELLSQAISIVMETRDSLRKRKKAPHRPVSRPQSSGR
eukprot:1658735-Ditylum_brightwellii.AAC.1